MNMFRSSTLVGLIIPVVLIGLFSLNTASAAAEQWVGVPTDSSFSFSDLEDGDDIDYTLAADLSLTVTVKVSDTRFHISVWDCLEISCFVIHETGPPTL